MTTPLYLTLEKTIYASLVLVMLCSFSIAQDVISTTPKPDSLELLEGFTQTIYFSPGHEDRAKSIALFMENASDYFQKEIGFTPKTTLYILAPQHWKEVAATLLQDVYGFPHNIDDSRLAIAAEDNDFWRSFLPPVHQLP